MFLVLIDDDNPFKGLQRDPCLDFAIIFEKFPERRRYSLAEERRGDLCDYEGVGALSLRRMAVGLTAILAGAE